MPTLRTIGLILAGLVIAAAMVAVGLGVSHGVGLFIQWAEGVSRG